MHQAVSPAAPLARSNTEHDLFVAIHAGSRARARLARNEAISLDERHRLEVVIQRSDHAKTQIVEAYRGLVIDLARRYAGTLHGALAVEDLVQEGLIGLLTAIDRFNPERGHRFATYATWWVRQAIGRALDNTSRTIRLPVHANDRLRRVVRAEHQLRQTLGREPVPAEIAEAAQVSLAQWEDIQRAREAPLSLHAPIGADSDEVLGAVIPANDSVPEIVEQADVAATIDAAMRACLSDRERLVLRALFGLDGPPPTLEALGQRLGITRERVRQVRNQALAKLRSHPALASLREAEACAVEGECPIVSSPDSAMMRKMRKRDR